MGGGGGYRGGGGGGGRHGGGGDGVNQPSPEFSVWQLVLGFSLLPLAFFTTSVVILLLSKGG